MIGRRKQEEYEVAKQDYAAKLQEINVYQKNFYGQMIPQIFHKLQDVDHRKTMQVRDSVKQAAQIERRIQPIIDKCLEEMVRSAEEVSPEAVINCSIFIVLFSLIELSFYLLQFAKKNIANAMLC